MSDEKVKLPRSSYEELCKIIKAYGKLTQPSTLDQVNQLASVGATVVSANNAFLAATGLIQGGKLKSATDAGRALARALDHEIPDEIQASWHSVVKQNDFLNKMALAVRIRRAMDESTFVSHIAYSAGEPKSPGVMTGARAVIDILRASGHISEENGKLTSKEPTAASTDQEGPEVDRSPELRPVVSISTPSLETSIPLPKSAFSLAIQVRIDAKPSELDGLGEKLKKLINALKGMEEQDESGR